MTTTALDPEAVGGRACPLRQGALCKEGDRAQAWAPDPHRGSTCPEIHLEMLQTVTRQRSEVPAQIRKLRHGPSPEQASHFCGWRDGWRKVGTGTMPASAGKLGHCRDTDGPREFRRDPPHRGLLRGVSLGHQHLTTLASLTQATYSDASAALHGCPRVNRGVGVIFHSA